MDAPVGMQGDGERNWNPQPRYRAVLVNEFIRWVAEDLLYVDPYLLHHIIEQNWKCGCKIEPPGMGEEEFDVTMCSEARAEIDRRFRAEHNGMSYNEWVEHERVRREAQEHERRMQSDEIYRSAQEEMQRLREKGLLPDGS